MKERILITGGAGFIGSHTADALRRRGYRIRILDNLSRPVHSGTWPEYMRDKGYELMKGDVRDKRVLARALRGVRYVFHIAAYQDQRPDFSTFFHTNTVSTALMYELIAAKRLPVKKIILASSQFVYGDGMYRCSHRHENFYPELRPEKQFKKGEWDIACPHGAPARFVPFREDQRVNPTNSYGLSKHALEMLAFRLGKTHGIPTVALRYSVVQGSRQSPKNLYSGALRIFVTQALKGKPITVFEDGGQKRDFVNIEDVVRANLLVLNNKKADFEIFNVGGGRAYTVLQFANTVKRITGSDSRIAIGGYRSTDTRHAVSDITKLKKLGWRPKYGPEKSVRDYIKWFNSEYGE